MPEDEWLTEMQAGYCGDVKAAKLWSLLTGRHVYAGHLGQVRVSDDARHLSPKFANGRELKGDQQRYEHPDERSSSHVGSSEKDTLRQFGALSLLAPWERLRF
ncbi:hypothetical protein [Povalibacter sp.]|uniref:hypothetical protein n=1 Tax=Povalibacter sp. TaxID=1962978 RepID=UPI002F408D2B